MWGEMAHCCGAPVVFKRGFQGVTEAGNASASPDRVAVVITDLSRSLLRGGVQRAQTGRSGWPGVLPAPWAEVAQTRLPSAGRGAGGDVGVAFGFSKRSAEWDVRVSPDMSGGALQARPLAGVCAQGTEALEAALPGSSWVLPRVTSANTAAMAPLGAAWPGAAVGASGDSLTGDQFAGAGSPYSYGQRGKSLLSEQSVQINCYQPRATQAFHCCQTATLRGPLQLPGSSGSNQLWVWNQQCVPPWWELQQELHQLSLAQGCSDTAESAGSCQREASTSTSTKRDLFTEVFLFIFCNWTSHL